MMWQIFHAPTMIWSVVLGLCEPTNDGQLDDEGHSEIGRAWSSAIDCSQKITKHGGNCAHK